MASLIDEGDLEWLEGISFHDHVGPQAAETIDKLVGTYRAAVRYLRELDARRDGDARGHELVRAEVALRQAIWKRTANERVIAGLRALHDDVDPPDGWETRVMEVAKRDAPPAPWWRRMWSWLSW